MTDIPIVLNPTKDKCIDVSQYKDKIFAHVNEVMDSANYRNYFRSKNQDPAKAKKDMANGKFAEFVISSFIKSLGYECNEPDLTVYDKKDKSFDPDLKCNGPLIIDGITLNASEIVKISCKSFTADMGKRYGYSAVLNIGTDRNPNTIENALQGLGNAGLDTSFKDPEHYVMAVAEVDTSNYTGKIYSISNFKYLMEKSLFKPPKLDYLKKIKACLYHADLEKHLSI